MILLLLIVTGIVIGAVAIHEVGRWKKPEIREQEHVSKDPLVPVVSALKKVDGLLPEKLTYRLWEAGSGQVPLVAEIWEQLSSGVQVQLIDLWYDAGYLEELVNALGSRDEQVRVNAAGALIKIKDKKMIPLLIRALTEPEKYLPARVAEVLIAIGKDAVEPLIRELPQMDDHIKCLALEILGEIADERAVEPIINELTGANIQVRQSAAVALGVIGHSNAVESLIILAKDSDQGVRMRAVKALGQIGSTRAIPVLKEALKDEARWVCTNAREALDRITLSRESREA